MIIVRDKVDEKPVTGRIALYARVSSVAQKEDVERQKSRRTKGGKNRKKTCRTLAKPHTRVTNMRKDAAHKLTSYRSLNHALVALEDLPVTGMLKNHQLAQAVSDSTFGDIRRQFDYKTSWYGL